MLAKPVAAALRTATKQQQRLLAAHTRAQVTTRRPLLLQRSFASEPTIKRAKPIKVKKSEARRRVEPKAVEETQDALVEAPQAPPPSPYMPSEQQQQPTFGQMMKANFFWGIGMALAFSLVGAIFSSMEEVRVFRDIPFSSKFVSDVDFIMIAPQTNEPGKYDGSEVTNGSDEQEQ